MGIQFFEKVLVKSSDRFPSYIGKKGIVLGISEDKNQVYSYSVFFDDEYEGLSFLPGEIAGTGEIVDKRRFYDVDHRIKVSIKNGNGFIVE
jgi:hypothetical protein